MGEVKVGSWLLLLGGTCARKSMVAPITVSSASRYFLTTGVRSAITNNAEEQARRSLETVKVQRAGERKRQ
jgi:hypothetical protein